MAARPRSFLRTARRLRAFFVAAAALSAAEVAWLGWEPAMFTAYVCTISAVSWCLAVAAMSGVVADGADDVVARLAAYSDATIRRALAEVEPTLDPIERDVHEAVVARLRAARPGVFEYRYSDPEEADRG